MNEKDLEGIRKKKQESNSLPDQRSHSCVVHSLSFNNIPHTQHTQHTHTSCPAATTSADVVILSFTRSLVVAATPIITVIIIIIFLIIIVIIIRTPTSCKCVWNPSLTSFFLFHSFTHSPVGGDSTAGSHETRTNLLILFVSLLLMPSIVLLFSLSKRFCPVFNTNQPFKLITSPWVKEKSIFLSSGIQKYRMSIAVQTGDLSTNRSNRFDSIGGIFVRLNELLVTSSSLSSYSSHRNERIGLTDECNGENDDVLRFAIKECVKSNSEVVQIHINKLLHSRSHSLRSLFCSRVSSNSLILLLSISLLIPGQRRWCETWRICEWNDITMRWEESDWLYPTVWCNNERSAQESRRWRVWISLHHVISDAIFQSLIHF